MASENLSAVELPMLPATAIRSAMALMCLKEIGNDVGDPVGDGVGEPVADQVGDVVGDIVRVTRHWPRLGDQRLSRHRKL